MNFQQLTRYAAITLVLCVVELCEGAFTGRTTEAIAQAPRRVPPRPTTARPPTARPPAQPRTTARPLPAVRLGSPKAMLEEAQRSLKLGSSYREARNYDLAQKYIQRGIELAQKADNRYWEATGYEYLGLVYRDIGDRTAALAALQRASDIFNGLIKQPDGSQNATKALMDDVQRNDRSRPPSSVVPTPSLASPLPQRPSPTAPPAPSSDIERERTLNRQLTERVMALESKIRALEDRSLATPGGSALPPSNPLPLSMPTPATESSPGVIARTMPRQVPDGGKPQAEFAPFQTDKKTRPEPVVQPRPAPARATTMDVVTLPVFTLQIGVGAGYNLNVNSRVTARNTTVTPSTTFVNGGAPALSFPLLSISGDYFVIPNLSVGLMYGYYPGPDQTDSVRTITGTTTSTVGLTQTTRSYHLVALRSAYHFVRDRTMDVYAGISLGTLLNLPLFDPLRLYAGLMAGFQYNFTRQVGAFIELSGGGAYVGTTAVENSTLPIQIGAYGRLGLAINF
ncbi:MAG: tetratricopeptide repeat protein [Candidatus Kapaibacteriota bacterium]|jgi:hypothetical protein